MMKKYQISNIKYQIDKSSIKNIFYISYVFFIFYFLFFISFAKAKGARAQSISLSISPPLLEVMIKPGKSITQVYKLTNTGEAVVVTPKLFELGVAGIKEDTDFSRDKWISIISNDIAFDKPFLLAKDKTAEFLVKINPPAGTKEQDYYRALVFTTTPQPAFDTTMSSFAQNLASPLLVTVTASGVLVKDAQIVKFDLPQILDSFDGFWANIEIKNSGKNYFRPVGKLILKGPFAQASYDLIPFALLAGQTRKLLTQFSAENAESKTLSLAGFYIGRYQVTLDFSLDESTTKVTAVKTFYALPWKAGLGIFVIVLLIVIKKRSKTDARKK